MGYRSEVSIIVGKKVDKKIAALQKKFKKEREKCNVTENAVANLDYFLGTREVSKDGNFVRYNAYLKWNTEWGDPDYEGLARLEKLVKKYAEKYDYAKGEEASFVRLGESDEDREDLANTDLQGIGIVTSVQF